MITIVTDSSACIKKEEARRLGVKIVPMNYAANGRVYSESYCGQNGDFENLLRGKTGFTTSQPNLSAFLSCFEEELALGNEILCITISSRLSGTYSAAHNAAKQTESGNIVVFDSHLTAGGLYLLIKKARLLIDGGLTLKDAAKKLPDLRNRIATAFSVGDMTPLRKSGRIGFVRMSVETILNIKPILLLKDGAVISSGIARGEGDIIKKLTAETGAGVEEIVINYIGNSRLAANLHGVLSASHPEAPISIHKLGPALGIHLGMNAVAVSFISLP